MPAADDFERVLVDYHDLGQQHVFVIVVELFLVWCRGQETEHEAGDSRDDQ